ncbi:hypothetical protein BDR26DRAFT_936773 [Obelidium mucronatum]|nr:hypothetical protein BDR26DRAFT_936773 [Obelidium mucronatum]
MLAHRTFTASAESVSPANNAIRADKAFADVLLLVGPAKTPVYAHAAILAANCAYYKQALSVRWKSPVPKKGLDIDPAVKLRAVLTHPDIELQVMNIILEFIYTGTTEVPAILAEETALFADQILLESLKDQCLSYFTRNCISPVNAFDAFTLCGRLNYIKGQGTALFLASIDLSTAISSGKQCLKEMSPDIMAETLSFMNLMRNSAGSS